MTLFYTLPKLFLNMSNGPLLNLLKKKIMMDDTHRDKKKMNKKQIISIINSYISLLKKGNPTPYKLRRKF
jgi:hypothetical protein